MTRNAAQLPASKIERTPASRIPGARWIRAKIEAAPLRLSMLVRDRELIGWTLAREGGIFQGFRVPPGWDPAAGINLVRDGALVGLYDREERAQEATEAAIALSRGRV